jgi:pimeloyl-ACP methyl ester carboxylesterase
MTAANECFPQFSNEESERRYLAAYDKALENWPLAYESLRIPTDFGQTHILASGPAHGRTLLLLPSFAGTALAWRPNVVALSRHWRTYAVDVIGQPGKSVATRRLRDRHVFAKWMEDLLNHLGVEQADIAGCSFGGFLAANQASLTPDRVRRVVLIGPAGVFRGMSVGMAARMRVARFRYSLEKTLGIQGKLKRNLHSSSVQLHEEDNSWRSLIAVTRAEAPTVSVINADVFSRAELRAIRAPMMLLLGEHEQLYDARETVRIARRRMPALRAEIVEGADHVAAMTQPCIVNELITSFLQGEVK